MGSSTAFPIAMARGATWDIDLERRIGNAIGLEGKAQGANLFAGVCINLPRHPAWGRIQETYGEDPILLGEFGSALTQGVQNHIMACVKHFALNSIENARFRVDVQVDEDVLHEGLPRCLTTALKGVFAYQHAVGIIFVLSFSTYFFQLAGLDTQKSLNLGVGVAACGVAGNICLWFIVNRFSRPPIFILGMFACTTILLLIGVLDVVPTGAAKWAMSSLTVVFSFVYFLAIGAVAFVLLGEVSSLSQRAQTTALATATQANFSIIMFFAVPHMVNPDAGNLGGKVGFIFGGLSAFASITCVFYIPELEGRTCQEIDTMFYRQVPLRKMRSYTI
ncbi:maltose permease [Fusarium phyllophilum]|uniref:Maltose permease n=1 Tax=Fusarium phyllophilum TaxID=47803 RepID=A0A8H5K713_9HYPO|nr:maltose permease [Fusarium phyllophilum]